MLAVRFVGVGCPAQIEDVSKPSPAPGQVLIKIGGAGVCSAGAEQRVQTYRGIGARGATTSITAVRLRDVDEHSLRGSRGEQMEVIAMARAGRIHTATTDYPMTEAVAVYAKLKAGTDSLPGRPGSSVVC